MIFMSSHSTLPSVITQAKYYVQKFGFKHINYILLLEIQIPNKKERNLMLKQKLLKMKILIQMIEMQVHVEAGTVNKMSQT